MVKFRTLYSILMLFLYELVYKVLSILLGLDNCHRNRLRLERMRRDKDVHVHNLLVPSLFCDDSYFKDIASELAKRLPLIMI